MRRPRVLVVDDEPGMPALIAGLLGAGEFDVVGAQTEDAALKLAVDGQRASEGFDVVLLDYYLTRSRGDAVLKELARRAVEARVILMSGIEPAELAIEALRLGAFDFVAKPLARAELRLRVERACRDRAADDRPDKRRPRKSDVIIGGGTWIKELYERISMVATTDVTVAIAGDSGTGKELVARTIHNLSKRNEGPFVVVNCAAIPEGLLEDELFGHVRGAFTDASRDREGLIAAAHNGTLFLDEIAEMSLDLQAKLLRVIEDHSVRRVGATHDRSIDVRVVAATYQDLQVATERERFRLDLYYLLTAAVIAVPPLRERVSEILPLAERFAADMALTMGRPAPSIAEDAADALVSHPWLGNVRELRNAMGRAVALCEGEELRIEHFALNTRRTAPHLAIPSIPSIPSIPEVRVTLPDRAALQDRERDAIVAALDACQGNQTKAAEMLGMPRRTLVYKLTSLGIREPRRR